MDFDISLLCLKDEPEWKEKAAAWFSSKWSVPYSAYLESIEESFSNTIPQWYICIKDGKIIAGLGVIENDFHEREDLTPNVCAVYTEPEFRGRGIAGMLLKHVCMEMKKDGLEKLYLLTDHTGFYERYGWKFLCMVKGTGEEYESRMYEYSLC